MIRSSLLVVLVAGRALAQEPAAIAIERIDPAVCFSAAHLAARLRASLGGGEVRIGGGGEASVAVSVQSGALDVVVTRRSSGIVRSERRRLPLDGNCALLADTVAMIVARVAAPLGFRPATLIHAPPSGATPPAATARPRSPDADRAAAAKSAAPPREGATPPSATAPPATLAAATPPPAAAPAPSSPTPATAATATSPTAPAAGEPDPVAIARPAATRPRARLFLGAAFRYAVPLDGGGSEPGFLATLDVRVYRRWLATASGGVEGASSVDRGGGVGATLRRAPFRVGVAYELPIPSGALRAAAGGLLEVWSARATGVARPTDGTALHPGLYASLAYHLALGRAVDLFAGLDFEYSWVTESFVVDGLGPVATTPHFTLCPLAGASVNLF